MSAPGSERRLTYVVVAICTVITATFIGLAVANASGRIGFEVFEPASYILSVLLMTVIIVYGAIVMRSKDSASEAYERYVREREEEDRKPR